MSKSVPLPFAKGVQMLNIVKNDIVYAATVYGDISVIFFIFGFIIGLILWRNNIGIKKLLKSMTLGLLLGYGWILISITLLSREQYSRFGLNLIPFSVFGKDAQNLAFVLENFVMLIPLGLLLPILSERVKMSKYIFTAFLVSMCIECLQLITGRGYFQIDDIWLNTLGSIIGTRLYFLLRKCISKFGLCA